MGTITAVPWVKRIKHISSDYSKALKGLSPRRQLAIPLPHLVCSSFVQVSEAFLQEQSRRTASPVSIRRVENLTSMGDLNERDSTGLLQ